MHPIHRTAIAVLLGLAVVAGLLGLARTLDLGAASPAAHAADPAMLAKGNHRLDRVAAALRRARASRPPALPALPKYPAATPVTSPAPAQPAVQQVTYVRPPPRIVTVHRSGGEHEGGSDGADD